MAPLAEPASLTYCTVEGNFAAFIADGLDANDLPDWEAMSGTASITPNIPYGQNFATGEKRTFFPRPIACTIDADGDLARNGTKGVKLLADGPSISPQGFTYQIKFTLTPPGEETPVVYGPFDFSVVPGGTVNLVDVVPVAGTSGTPLAKGEQGEAGDMSPVAGPGTATGAVILTEAALPSTRLWTLTGNVTLTLPTPPATHSGTITLVTTQDATGGRTITFPASVKWTDGIVRQPALGANTTSVTHLLWTGQQWLGMSGGNSFA